MKKENILNPILLCDFYKISHRYLYPSGIKKGFSTFTCRKSRLKDASGNTVNNAVIFGIQRFIKSILIETFDKYFFERNIDDIIKEYKSIISSSLNIPNDEVDTDHIEDLHKLGYLPIKIRAVDEGTCLPIRVPFLTIENTHEKFFWLIGYLETLISMELWSPITTATIAGEFFKVTNSFADETCDNKDFLPFQCHDFSLRGTYGIEGGELVGLGHLLFHKGSDNIISIKSIKDNYITNDLIAGSVKATEHSIQCAWGKENEKNMIVHLLEKYPNDIISIVMDTWDFWKVITEYLPSIKDVIMNHKGKLVVRPDSGDPVKIICGDPDSDIECVRKGLIECLWDTFGGSINSKGFKELDPHIGAIYGDSITLDRCQAILSQLKSKGFASNNIVFGIGSFTYVFNTRDTLGMAMKLVAIQNSDDTIQQVFKSPKTDDGTKISQKGLVKVYNEDGVIKYKDEIDNFEELESDDNLLKVVFENGKLINELDFDKIREFAKNTLK